MPAPGNGNLEFSRQIVKFGIASKRAVNLQRQRRSINNFFAVESRKGAAGNGSSHIAAGSGSGQAHFPQTLQNIRQRFNAHPVQLNILAHGDVRNAPPVPCGEARDRAHLFTIQKPVGNANTHHKKRHGLAFAVLAACHAQSIALRIHAPRAKVRAQPFRWNGVKPIPRKLLNLVEMIPGVLGTFQALDALRLGFGFAFPTRVRNHFRHVRFTLKSRA